jgi:DNA-binding MurR/RpiR family transcriptional regulator
MSDAMDLAPPSRWPRRSVADAPPSTGPSLLQRIEADLPNLSPQLRKVADQLVRERGLPHRHRITDLAMLSGTAPVTIVRFAKRYGLKGFCEMKFAFLEEAGNPPGAANTGAVRPHASEASVAEQALEGALRTIGALRPIVDQPGFMQAARWLHEADVVWVSGLMPGDAPVADCVTQSLQRHGVSVRSGCMTRMAAHARAFGDKSVQLHVALASALHSASDFSSAPVGQECRRIVLSRSPQPGVACADLSITLGIDIDVIAQALPAVVGLLAAWDGAIRSIRNDH